MTMAEIGNIFDVGARAMSAQMVRMNTTASNLANAGSVAGTPDEAFRPLRPVFETVYAGQMGQVQMAAPVVDDVVSLDRDPQRLYHPDHPKADADGYVYAAPVNTEEEMVEMLEASRQYQNVVETMSTLRGLMARTLSLGQ